MMEVFIKNIVFELKKYFSLCIVYIRFFFHFHRKIRAVDFFTALIGRCFITILIAFYIVVSLNSPYLLNHVNDVNFSKDIMVAIIGIIVTIFVLAFSLIIIPVQKASETFSMFIFKAYFEDKRNRAAFVFISFAIMMMFLLIIFKMKGEYKLSSGIFILAIMLDWARYYYRYVSQLLSPQNAVLTILKEARFEFYKDNKLDYVCDKNIMVLIDEVSEIASKAVKRGEIALACSSSKTLYEIARYYLQLKNVNLKKRGGEIMESIYSSLQRINFDSLEFNDTYTSLYIIILYVKLVRLLKHSYPHKIYIPLEHLIQCIKIAEGKEMNEILFKSTMQILKVASFLPRKLNISVYMLLIDCLRDITAYFLKKLNFNYSTITSARMMELVSKLFENNGAKKIRIFSYLLGRLGELVQIAVECEKKQFWLSVYSPLAGAYFVKRRTWIGRFVLKSEGKTDEIIELLQEHFENIDKKTLFAKRNSKTRQDVTASIHQFKKLDAVVCHASPV